MNRMTTGSAGTEKAARVVGERQPPAKKESPEPVAPPAPYLPYAGIEPDPVAPPREPWYGVFLRDLAERGLMSLAAARAGVHISKVRRRRDADPEFAAEVGVAREYYCDYLEWESVTLGKTSRNPLPFFARLKAERPNRYIDRQAVLLATGITELPAEDGKALLLAMFGQAATIQALDLEAGGGGRIFDTAPPGSADASQ
jgi:hypothetical protein